MSHPVSPPSHLPEVFREFFAGLEEQRDPNRPDDPFRRCFGCGPAHPSGLHVRCFRTEEGVASPADIDTAMEKGYGHAMGPLRTTDLVGLDVRLGIAEYLDKKFPGGRFTPPALLRKMVAEGRLGQKTGRGFHDWTAPR